MAFPTKNRLANYPKPPNPMSSLHPVGVGAKTIRMQSVAAGDTFISLVRKTDFTRCKRNFTAVMTTGRAGGMHCPLRGFHTLTL